MYFANLAPEFSSKKKKDTFCHEIRNNLRQRTFHRFLLQEESAYPSGSAYMSVRQPQLEF